MAQKVVYVHKATYQQLCAGFQSKNDDDGEYIKRHRRAAKNKTGVHLVKSDIERLQAGQPDAKEGDAETKTPETKTPVPATTEASNVELTESFGSNESNESDANPAAEKQGLSLAESIGQLDPNDDDHWTKAGLPAIAAVETIFGKDISREDIEAAAPGFNRSIALQANV